MPEPWALVFQPFPLSAVLESLNSGFRSEMAMGIDSIPQQVALLPNSGGLHAMKEAVIIAFMLDLAGTG